MSTWARCLLFGHKWAKREGGKRGTWWARWEECPRCEAIRNYRYDYQAGDPPEMKGAPL